MIAKVKAVIGKDHYQTKLEAGANSLVADEAIANGGGHKGFSPFELLASSLAACTSITLRMYVDRKQWKVTNIEVTVTIEKDEIHEATHFERAITFEGDLTDEHREKLLDIANHCPVHKALSKSIYINTLI